jgi:hypothetical protein
MLDKETLLIIALAGLIIYILVSNKDEYIACNSNRVSTRYAAPSSVVPTSMECNPISGTGCAPPTTFSMEEANKFVPGVDNLGNSFTDVSNPMAGPTQAEAKTTSQFGYPMKFATKGYSKMA